MRDFVYLHRESEVSTRPALDQRSTSANESVEEAWRISCAPRVNWLLLHNRKQNYQPSKKFYDYEHSYWNYKFISG